MSISQPPRDGDIRPAESGVTEAEARSDRWLAFAGRDWDKLVIHCETGRVFTCRKEYPPLSFVAPSVTVWLEDYADRIGARKYEVKEGFGDYYLSRDDGMH